MALLDIALAVALVALSILLLVYIIIYIKQSKTCGVPNPTPTPPTPTPTPKPTPTSTLKLVESVPGSTLKDMFMVDPEYVDKTNGDTKYGDFQDLMSFTQDGALLRMENNKTSNTEGRRSIKLKTKNAYDSGVWVFDVAHVPVGQTVWPAIWLRGEEDIAAGKDGWPKYGEIDILEQTHKSTFNAMTLHTRDGCNQSHVQVGPQTSKSTANPSMDCGGASQYVGCGVVINDPVAWGKSFNSNGGGVYVCEVTPRGAITIWFIPRQNWKGMPSTLTELGEPRVKFQECPGYFGRLRAVINIACCGDWAGAEFDNTSNARDNCKQFQKNPANNANYNDAYFLIKQVSYYN